MASDAKAPACLILSSPRLARRRTAPRRHDQLASWSWEPDWLPKSFALFASLATNIALGRVLRGLRLVHLSARVLWTAPWTTRSVSCPSATSTAACTPDILVTTFQRLASTILRLQNFSITHGPLSACAERSSESGFPPLQSQDVLLPVPAHTMSSTRTLATESVRSLFPGSATCVASTLHLSATPQNRRADQGRPAAASQHCLCPNTKNTMTHGRAAPMSTLPLDSSMILVGLYFATMPPNIL